MNLYAIAIGSNRGHGTTRTPDAMVERAVAALTDAGLGIMCRARVMETAPIGPSKRRYANSAVIVQTPLDPEAFLTTLKLIERQLGRRRGQRWGARTIDLDIVLWSGGRWFSRNLCIPHPLWRARAFVLAPLAEIAGSWRDPWTGRTVCQWAAIHRWPRATR